MVVLAAVVVAVGVVAWAHSRHGGEAGPCVTVTIASTMGGATIHKCGADAARFCRENGPSDATVAAACRREGF